MWLEKIKIRHIICLTIYRDFEYKVSFHSIKKHHLVLSCMRLIFNNLAKLLQFNADGDMKCGGDEKIDDSGGGDIFNILHNILLLLRVETALLL